MSVLVDGELVLYGFVGDNFWGEGFTARDVIDALAEHGRTEDITVRINSGGGYVDDGIAIFNALSNHKGKVTVIVDSLAASSASVIAMAGSERVMRKGAMLMIHDPASIVWGTSDDMARAVQVLDKHADNLAGIYADVTGEPLEDIRREMKSELWMNAAEAVERGLATSANDNDAGNATAFDYGIYANAPERLVALADQKRWNIKAEQRRSHSAGTSVPVAPRQSKETAMTDKRKAEQGSAEDKSTGAHEKSAGTDTAVVAAEAANAAKARIKAITGSAEAKGREAMADHIAFNTDMSSEEAENLMAAAPKAEEATAEPSYEERRTTASGLARPSADSGKKAGRADDLNPSAIYAKRRESMKGA